MCKTNGNAYKAEIDNQKKLIEILNKNIDFNNLVKIMFDIYFNKDIKDGHKISYKSNTSINNDIELNVYKFLFSFAPDCGKQYGKGEFLRCYASHLSPNLIEKGDCMIRTNAVAELKNANKNEYGNLMFNRHNYYTANGNSNEILLNFF